MGIYVNPDNSLFNKVLNKKYVDKTGFLAYTNSVINTEDRFICITRPRRFGKSMTANMLSAYYSKGCDPSNLFKGLKIETDPEFKQHLNSWNVIHVDMTSFVESVDGYDYLENFNIAVLSELKEEFSACEDAKSIKEALISIYKKSGEQFIFIIDEWDIVFRQYPTNTELQFQYMDLLRSLFKSNDSGRTVALVYLTGILPIKKYKSELCLNNFNEFSMLNSSIISEYVGFTEKEVKELCEEYNLEFDMVREWYDGYVIGDHHIYNPKAIMSVLETRKFKNYWSRTGSLSSLAEIINRNFDGLKESIIELVSGESCRVDVNSFENDLISIHSRDNVLTLLVHLGYLAYDFEKKEVYIPNKEIRNYFAMAIDKVGWNKMSSF